MLGMICAHFGVAVFVAGVLVVESTSIEKDLRFAPGQSITVGELEFRFDGVQHAQGPNFSADQGTISVSRAGTQVATLHPQKRIYTRNNQPQTESAIDPGLFRDVYVALGEPVGSDGAWAVRIYIKPFVRWIWLGALFMMFGGFIAAGDRRFRLIAGVQDSGLGMGKSVAAHTETALANPPPPIPDPGVSA
jgi:cytochrome c-type biogenesis protein CcmF